MSDKKIYAVTYSRVSSQRQVDEGHGAESQENRCIEFAKLRGYHVIKSFSDLGISGGKVNRTGMNALLAFIRKRDDKPVVIIDDISRLARGLDAHIRLRMEISNAGGKLESPSIDFGEDSDSQLVENLLASVSQHQRQKNAEQVVHRMRARSLAGYWVAGPVVGYKIIKTKEHGKLLSPDQPVANVIKTAFESFASGRFETQTEIKRYFESQACFPKRENGKVHLQKVKAILTRPLYAGYLHSPSRGIHLQPAKHQPLISYKTFLKVQKKLENVSKTKAPIRKTISNDFILRGFVTCGECQHPMTSCWSKGPNKKYAYYFCQNKDCKLRKKSISRGAIEGAFESLLASLVPQKEVFHMLEKMLKKLWDDRSKHIEENLITVQKEKAKLDKQINNLVMRVAEAGNDNLINAYEKRIYELEGQKIALDEKSQDYGNQLPDFERVYRTTFSIMQDVHKHWVSSGITQKMTIIRMVFLDKLSYHMDEGYRTAPLSMPFRVLKAMNDNEYDMVEAAGVEPASASPLFEALHA